MSEDKVVPVRQKDEIDAPLIESKCRFDLTFGFPG